MINIYTIGFTKKSAEEFFSLLINNNVVRIIDIRYENKTQLSGFTRIKHIAYLAREIGNIDYIYKPEYAPSEELKALSPGSNKRWRQENWEIYEPGYLELIKTRNIIENLNLEEFHQNCFLCSEPSPANCHRRLLAEYFQEINSDVNIIHL